MSWFYKLFNGDPASNHAIVAFADVGPNDHVLDIGCGPGAALEHAAGTGAKVTGVDPTPAMVKQAGLRVPSATVIHGSVEHLDFESDSFNVVWSISAYHHWAYPDTGVEQILNVLAPGGRVFLVEHKLKDGKTGHGLNMDGAEEVADLLARKGYEETSVQIMPAKRKEYVVVTGRKAVDP